MTRPQRFARESQSFSRNRRKIDATPVRPSLPTGLGMTLAIIFVVLFSPHAVATASVDCGLLLAQQDQSTAQPTPPSTAKPTPSQTSPAHSTAKPKSTHPRKKKPAPDCSSASPSKTSGTASSPDATKPATANDPCAPKKIIVKQGGIAEPSIQLVGPGGQPSSADRDAITQTRDATEANLKQLAGRSLTGEQQDTVTQIRQYMDQSKAAVANGELDRARTLAWKARTLSEDLVNPQK